MELFEEIRQGYAAGETIQGLATKYGIHRRMVRQAISAAIPPARKTPGREQSRLVACRRVTFIIKDTSFRGTFQS